MTDNLTDSEEWNRIFGVKLSFLENFTEYALNNHSRVFNTVHIFKMARLKDIIALM